QDQHRQHDMARRAPAGLRGIGVAGAEERQIDHPNQWNQHKTGNRVQPERQRHRAAIGERTIVQGGEDAQPQAQAHPRPPAQPANAERDRQTLADQLAHRPAFVAERETKITSDQVGQVVEILCEQWLVEPVEMPQPGVCYWVLARPHQHQNRVAGRQVTNDEGQKRQAKQYKDHAHATPGDKSQHATYRRSQVADRTMCDLRLATWSLLYRTYMVQGFGEALPPQELLFSRPLRRHPEGTRPPQWARRQDSWRGTQRVGGPSKPPALRRPRKSCSSEQ